MADGHPPADGRSGDIRWPIQHRLMADPAPADGRSLAIQHRLMADPAPADGRSGDPLADPAPADGRSSTG
jgi:hypothetical protein